MIPMGCVMGILTLVVWPCLVFSATYFDSIELNNHLKANYSRKFRPVLDTGRIVDIYCSGSLVSVLEFNEIDGILKTVFTLKCSWIDEIMNWNISEFNGLSHIRMTTSDIWFPPFGIVNAVDDIFLNTNDNSSEHLRIGYNGNVTLITGAIVKSTCDVNIQYYPFDSHQCNIQIISFGYDSTEVVLHVTDDFIDESVKDSNNQWVISHVRNTIENVIAQGVNASTILFKIELKRRPTFLLLNLFFPLSILEVLNLMVFCLPSSSGERISFSITVLLTTSTLWTIIVEKMPPTSRPLAYISVFNISVIIANSIITVTAIFISRIYHSDSCVRVSKSYLSVVKFVQFFSNIKYPCEQGKTKTKTEVTVTALDNVFDTKIGREKIRKRRNTVVQDIHNLNDEFAKRKSVLLDVDDDSPTDRISTVSEGENRAIYDDEVTWDIVGKALDKIAFMIFSIIFCILDLGIAIALDPFDLFNR